MAGPSMRNRILDIAEANVMARGFSGTSIDGLAAETGLSRNGIFYHFRDKNALAQAMIERFATAGNDGFHRTVARARQFSDDPLQVLLILLKMTAEYVEGLYGDETTPGCLVAAACYQERLFDQAVREANRQAMLMRRNRIKRLIEDAAELYPPREEVDLDDLADMLTSLIDGGIVVARALRDPKALSAQVLIYRSFLKLLFSRRPV